MVVAEGVGALGADPGRAACPPPAPRPAVRGEGRPPYARTLQPSAPGDGVDRRGPRAIPSARGSGGRGFVIRMPGHPDPPVPRLIASLSKASDPGLETLVLTSGSVSRTDLATVLTDGRRQGNVRVLVIGPLGIHPDASVARLRDLWDIEEACRASGLPVLALRLAPLVGPTSPLWHKLRSRPSLGARAHQLLHPLAESDAQATLERAAVIEWTGSEWYEVAGSDPMTLIELEQLARSAGPPLPRGSGAWEPSLDEMANAPIPDPSAWSRRFALAAAEVGRVAEGWS